MKETYQTSQALELNNGPQTWEVRTTGTTANVLVKRSGTTSVSTCVVEAKARVSPNAPPVSLPNGVTWTAAEVEAGTAKQIDVRDWHSLVLTVTTVEGSDSTADVFALVHDADPGTFRPDDSTKDYSTSEVALDYTGPRGTTVYRKTINFGALPGSSTAGTTAHGISGTFYVFRHEMWSDNGSGTQIPSPYADASDNNNHSLVIDGTNVRITTGSTSRSSFSGYITIWYEKA